MPPTPPKHFPTLTLLLILLSVVIAACGGTEDQTAAFRIGVMESLTGAGETYGTVVLQSKQMAQDGIKIILGTSCSGAMLGVAPRAEKDGVVLFSGLASNPYIANAL